MLKVAINGMGRVGRLALRRLQACPGVEVVAVNDLSDARTLAHLVKHDTVHGLAPFPVAQEGDTLRLGDRRIPVLREADPALLPFGRLGATLVLECTGRFVHRDQAQAHLRHGVARVLVSAPMEDADRTLVRGVNEEDLRADDRILSAGSGTLNALAPVVKVLDDAFGLRQALLTVVHSYTADQRILDLPHPDLRRARAAGLSMIPTASSAPAALVRVLPHLAGRIEGVAIRVPTPDVSLLDLMARLDRAVTPDGVNEAFRCASHQAFAGLLGVLDEELVSADLVGRIESALVDPFLTRTVGPRAVKLLAWYDNEAAYAARLVELAQAVAR